jgi:hypothetical protein
MDRTHYEGDGCGAHDVEPRESVEVPQGLPDSGRGYTLPEGEQAASYHTTKIVDPTTPQAVHEGDPDDCPRCSPPGAAPSEASPEQLCFALHKGGGLVTRDGRPVWAERKVWERLPSLATQVIPIKGAPPIGSLPMMTDKAGPDVVGQLLELLTRMEAQTAEVAKRIDLLDRIAGKGTEGLENLSLIISQRIHFVELLDRAAQMVDPDSNVPAGYPTYEQRLDWLAKWRETVGR